MSVNLLSLAVPLPVWFVAAMMTLSLGYAFSQYFHSTLHRDEAPLIVEALRHAKLLMAPTAHQVHHHTLDRDFAVITGWSNPVLNRLFNILKSRGILSDEALEPPRSL